MKKINVTLAFVLLVSLSYAQGILGDWYGTLHIQGTSLRLVFHIVNTGDGYATTMDSPDQSANGLTTDKTTFADNTVTIEAGKFNLTYTGTYLPDSNKINGNFTQGATHIPLNLSHDKSEADVAQARRPQDPKDFPYKREEVTFTNAKAGDVLAGTLTMPADGKASKIVVLITGSGPQNRDEELFNHRPFLVWSDWLTRQGIAVLRFDDRGTAKSTGIFSAATSADFADDAEAAVNYILSRNDLKGISIGLIGHSEGGMIAPMVASRNQNVKFIVLLAGPGVPIAELMEKQITDQMRMGGAPQEAIDRTENTSKAAFAFVTQNTALPADQFKQQLDTLLYHKFSAYPKADLENKSIDQMMQESRVLNTPWYRYFIAFNPADYLVKVKCPVLALDGTLDMQVNSEANLAGIKASLQKAGNKSYETVSLPGLNHLFQKATTGSVAEYSEITETVNPAALQKVSEWINHLQLK